MAGRKSNSFLDNSLFGPKYGCDVVIKPGQLEDLNLVWDNHLENMTNTVMLHESPVLALDYI